ncbi:HTH-type transcriptional regulator MalT [compost metagenome]
MSREHLLERLSKASHCRLVLVTGGAGYGKSTLLAQWRLSLIREGAKVAWLSLAEEDGTYPEYCVNLLGALQHAGLPLEEDWHSSLDVNSEEDALAFASILINTTARFNGRLFMFVDNFHRARDIRITTMMQVLIDRAPPNLHMVLASRSKPALQLGRLRGMGDVSEITCADLEFSFQESWTFLKSHLGDAIEPDIANSIHNATAGWPIGLQLMATALKGNPRKRAITSLLPKAGLTEYLTEEVLAPLPPALIDFLQKIAILPSFNTALAAQVAGSPTADEMITTLVAQNLFVLPINEAAEGQWYRLHPLFAEILTQRLTATSFDIRTLHLRAAEWYEGAGLLFDAAHQAVLCGDLEVLIQLLERNHFAFHSISHLKQFTLWLDNVPLERLTKHPLTLLMGTWGCLLLLQTSKAESWLDAHEAAEPPTSWAPHIALARAVIALQRDDLARCFALLEPLEGRQFNRPLYEQIRSAIYLFCMAYMGLHDKVHQYANAPRTALLYASDDEPALMFQAMVAHTAYLEGNIHAAEQLAIEALHRAELTHGPSSISADHCALVLAQVFYEEDRLERARELISIPGRLRFSTLHYMIDSALCFARLQCHQVSPQIALDYLAKTIASFRTLGYPRGIANMLAEQIRILLEYGDWRQAEVPLIAIVRLAQSHLNQQNPSDAEIVALKTFSEARLKLAKREPELALQHLDSIQPTADRYQRGHWQVQTTVLRALAFDMLGQREDAQNLLRSLLDLACSKGLIRSLLDEGKPLRELLLGLECRDDPVLESFRLRLIEAAWPANLQPDMATAGETELLNKRELAIIELLEQSMTNKRIAQALNLSLETVKWHLKNIYAKLGVTGRYEAIIAARKQQ